MDKLQELQNTLQYNFKNISLLKQALTHRSCKINSTCEHNERLEFLGDAVLDLLIGEYLFKKFPSMSEGELSKLRSSIVNEDGFHRLALEIKLGKYIYISASEENNNGRNKPSILSNTFEALIGAIYLESGIKIAGKITYNILQKSYPRIDSTLLSDYKTLLQKITQEYFDEIPTYELIAEFGPDHNKSFEIAVIFNHKKYACCIGNSKKNAQQACAKIAYLKLKDELNLRN